MKNLFLFINKIKFILGTDVKYFFLMIFGFLISSLFELLGIGIIYPYIRLISNFENVKNNEFIVFATDLFELTDKSDIILCVSILLVLVFLLRNFVYFVIQYLIQYNTNSVLESIRNKMFKTYVNSSYDYFLDANSSDLINKLTNDTRNFALNVYISILKLLSDTVLLVIVFSVIVYVNYYVIPIFVLFALFVFFFYKFSKNKTFEYGKIGTDSLENIIEFVNQAFLNIKITKIHVLEEFFFKKVKINSYNFKHGASKFWAFLLAPKLIIETMLIIGIVSFVMYYINTGGDPTKIISILSMIGIAALRLLPSVNNITSSLSAINHGKYVVDKLYTDLAELSEITLEEYTDSEITFKNNISIKDLSFSYKNCEELAVKNVNININHGDIIGVIGKSGSGKSTLIDLILGLLTPGNGNITVDDNEINTNNRNWKHIIGYVPQQIYLIDDSIMKNIAFGIKDEDIDESKIFEILKMVNLDKFIESLPDGIYTKTGENAVRLSGGQRQRIGIARALYKNPEVIIFDEATSALDSETEKVVTDAINNLGNSKTMIIVAHRLNTLSKCNIIYELENGSVKWSGPYNEIVDKQ
ncbi:MAG: ABC transporter ATP-binding protein/permease [Fibrobacterales bacterium]